MGYNSNKGPQHSGDVQYEGDPTDTQIDFENDFVAIKTNGQQRFIVSGASITASVDISGSGDLRVGGSLRADSGNFVANGNEVRSGEFRTPATRINSTHVSSSLNISGSKIYADGVLLTPGVVSAVANGVNNRVSTFSSADALNGEANLTFDGSNLVVVGNVTASQGVTGSSLRTAATVIDGIHVSSSLNISGAAFYGDGSSLAGISQFTLNGNTANGVVTRGSATTGDVETNLVFDGTSLTVTGAVSASSTLQAVGATTLGSTLSVTGAITAPSLTGSMGLYNLTNGTLQVGPEEVGTGVTVKVSTGGDNSVPILIKTPGNEILLAATGSGKVLVGGMHLDAKLNISGSDNDKLFSAKSNSHNPAFYISGSGNAFAAANMEISSSLTIRNSTPPAANDSFGIPGEIRWDANYLYVCTAINTWKRVALVGGW